MTSLPGAVTHVDIVQHQPNVLQGCGEASGRGERGET